MKKLVLMHAWLLLSAEAMRRSYDCNYYNKIFAGIEGYRNIQIYKEAYIHVHAFIHESHIFLSSKIGNFYVASIVALSKIVFCSSIVNRKVIALIPRHAVISY